MSTLNKKNYAFLHAVNTTPYMFSYVHFTCVLTITTKIYEEK
jgi:hypothetical protein